jgi:histidine triad (HIT) family protein
MSRDCIFCKILAGEIPHVKLYEDDSCLIVMDKFPVLKGQVLAIVKKHEPYIFDLDEEMYSKALLAAKKVVKAMDKAMGISFHSDDRTCMVVEGFEVAHAHIKLFPTFDKKLEIHGGKEESDEELTALAEKIKSEL